jgi:hypothetical protein
MFSLLKNVKLLKVSGVLDITKSYLKNAKIKLINKKSFLYFNLQLQGYIALALLFTELAGFCLGLVFLYNIYGVINNPNVQINNFILLATIIMVKYGLNSIKLKLNVLNRQNFIMRIKAEFIKSLWNHNNYQLIHRLLNREMMVLLDFISSISRILYFPIAIVVGLVCVYMIEGFAGIISTISLSFFAILSWHIAKKSMYLVEKIYLISTERITNASLFLKHRAYLKNWNEFDKIIDIEKITRSEISLRNKDSFWRSLDLYAIIFGSSFPVIIILLYDLWKNVSSDQYLTVILWFAPPLIALTMEVGRFFSDYAMAVQAFNKLITSLESNSNSEHQTQEITLDETWEIWNGTLDENTLQELNIDGLDFVKELQLDKELTGSESMIKQLEFLGANISSGQKTKVLIIRALNIAIARNLPLIITINLNSLDPISCYNLSMLFSKVSNLCKINLSEEQKLFLQEQISRIDNYEKQHASNISYYVGELLPEEVVTKTKDSNVYKKIFPVFGLLFLLPAFLFNLNASITASDLSTLFKTKSIVSIMCSTLFAATFLGFMIESNIRRKALNLQMKFLAKVKLDNLTDILQIVSRDFSVIVERVSWYVHDILWYISLIIVAFFSIVFFSGYKGLLINILFATSITFFFRYYTKYIANARLYSVDGVNQAVNSLVNISTVSNIHHDIINKKKAIWNNAGFKILSDSHIKMLVTKISFSNIIDAILGVFIFCIVCVSILNPTYVAVVVFVVNSLLAMEHTTVSLFQALTGLSSQIISYQRLDSFPENDQLRKPSLVTLSDSYCIIQACCHDFLNQDYVSIKLNRACIYSLSGPSGYGKTEYLKTISDFYYSVLDNNENNNACNKGKPLFISRESLDILAWLNIENLLKFIINKIMHSGYRVIFLDEALSGLDSVNKVDNFINQLRIVVEKTNSLVLLVDHRIELENKISITSIINNIK